MVCGLPGASDAEGLSLADVSRELVQRYGESYSRFVPVPGTTAESVHEMGSAGFTSDLEPNQVLVVLDPKMVCRIDVVGFDATQISASEVHAFAPLLREAQPPGICRARLLFDAAGRPNLFLFLSRTPEGYSGVWLNDAGSLAILHLVEGGSGAWVERTLVDMSVRPSTVLTIGSERFAYVAADGTIHVAMVTDNGLLVDRKICANATAASLPFYSRSAFDRYGFVADVAFQAVHRRGSVDPIAYISCP
jgi:hypothetical protein